MVEEWIIWHSYYNMSQSINFRVFTHSSHVVTLNGHCALKGFHQYGKRPLGNGNFSCALIVKKKKKR